MKETLPSITAAGSASEAGKPTPSEESGKLAPSEESRKLASAKPYEDAPTPFFLKVKDMDPDDTPRERAEKYGCGVLSVPDLWALILRTGVPGNPITQLCKEIMQSCEGKLSVLERRSRKDLRSIKGVGLLKSLQIEAVLELIRRYNLETPLEKPVIRSSTDIFNVMRNKIGNLDHEEIWALIMNRKGGLIDCLQLFKGGTDSSIFDVKILMKKALMEGASAIAISHNHPSGNLNPSAADDNVTRTTQKACSYFSISFLDHVIVTSHNTLYYSYSDHGRL